MTRLGSGYSARALAARAGICFVLTIVVLVASTFFSGAAQAGKIDDLAKQLQSDDYRVRTQAALTLGATRDVAAVKPLCGAIGDSNQTVRLAVVAALGKLGRDEGVPCLRKAKGSEKDSTVTAAIDKALEKIALGGDPPPPGSGAKYYVAIQVANKTKRPSLEIESIVRKSIQEKLLSNASCAVAPREESNKQASSIIKARNLTGFLLTASVEPFEYSGGNLKVQLKVAVSTYPENSIKASFSPWFKTQADKNSTEDENKLLKMTGTNVAESFIKVAGTL